MVKRRTLNPKTVVRNTISAPELKEVRADIAMYANAGTMVPSKNPPTTNLST